MFILILKRIFQGRLVPKSISGMKSKFIAPHSSHEMEDEDIVVCGVEDLCVMLYGDLGYTEGMIKGKL